MIVFNPSDSLVLPENEVNAVAREAVDAEILMYTVAVPEDGKTPQTSETSSAGALLGSLADATGGAQYSVSGSFTLAAIEQRINIQQRNQYTIVYIPKNPAANGTYRRVEIRLTPPAGAPSLTVRTITGYYPTSAALFAPVAQKVQFTQSPAIQSSPAPACSSMPIRTRATGGTLIIAGEKSIQDRADRCLARSARARHRRCLAEARSVEAPDGSVGAK